MMQEPTPSVAATVGLQRKIRAAVAAFASLSAAAAAQQVVYVDDDAAPGGDGQTWETAYRTIQEGLTVINAAPRIIRVAQGRYLASPPGGSYEDTITLLSGTTLMGGYRGLSPGGSSDDRNPAAFATVIDGDRADPLGPTHNALTCVTVLGTGVLIDGFEIMNGGDYHVRMPTPGELRIRACDFTSGHNYLHRSVYAPARGGRLYLERCRFQDVVGHTVVATHGAQDVVLIGCEFIACRTAHDAVTLDQSGFVSVSSCEFAGNVPGSSCALRIENAMEVLVTGTSIHDTGRGNVNPGSGAPLTIRGCAFASIDSWNL